MENTMPEPTMSGAAAGAAAAKTVVGAKIITVVAGVAGAAVMIAIRPNMTRKQMFLHALVAGVVSLFMTNPFLAVMANVSDWFDTTKWIPETRDEWRTMWSFVLGALSWGMMGALYYMRERFGSNPIETINDLRNVRMGDTMNSIGKRGAVRDSGGFAASPGPRDGVPSADFSRPGNRGKFDE